MYDIWHIVNHIERLTVKVFPFLRLPCFWDSYKKEFQSVLSLSQQLTLDIKALMPVVLFTKADTSGQPRFLRVWSPRDLWQGRHLWWSFPFQSLQCVQMLSELRPFPSCSVESLEAVITKAREYSESRKWYSWNVGFIYGDSRKKKSNNSIY